MSNTLLTAIRELELTEARGPARAVLMALADRADNSGKCWPSLSTIAKDAGVCLSTVKTALRKLRHAELITWTHTTTEAGDAGCNIYHVTAGGRAGDAPPRAGDDPPRAGDSRRRAAVTPQVGQETPEGRAGAGYKASREASMETSFALKAASSDPLPKTSKARGTLDELKSFAVEIGMPADDGEDCFDRWEGSGWKNNGKAIADWKATMRTWKRRGFFASQKGTTPKAGTVIIGGRTYAKQT